MDMASIIICSLMLCHMVFAFVMLILEVYTNK